MIIITKLYVFKKGSFVWVVRKLDNLFVCFLHRYKALSMAEKGLRRDETRTRQDTLPQSPEAHTITSHQQQQQKTIESKHGEKSTSTTKQTKTTANFKKITQKDFK